MIEPIALGGLEAGKPSRRNPIRIHLFIPVTGTGDEFGHIQGAGHRADHARSTTAGLRIQIRPRQKERAGRADGIAQSPEAAATVEKHSLRVSETWLPTGPNPPTRRLSGWMR